MEIIYLPASDSIYIKLGGQEYQLPLNTAKRLLMHLSLAISNGDQFNYETKVLEDTITKEGE